MTDMPDIDSMRIVAPYMLGTDDQSQRAADEERFFLDCLTGIEDISPSLQLLVSEDQGEHGRLLAAIESGDRLAIDRAARDLGAVLKSLIKQQARGE